MKPLKEVVVYEMDDVTKMINEIKEAVSVFIEIQRDISKLHDLEIIDDETFDVLNAKIKNVYNLILQ